MLNSDHSGSEWEVEWLTVTENGDQDSLENKTEVGEPVGHTLLGD